MWRGVGVMAYLRRFATFCRRAARRARGFATRSVVQATRSTLDRPRSPRPVETHRHSMIEMRARERSRFDVARVEYRQMTRVAVLVVDRREQISVAFCGRVAARDEDG